MNKGFSRLLNEQLPIQPSGKAIGQTTRNEIKHSLVNGLSETLNEVLDGVGEVVKVDGGVAVSLWNEKMKKWVTVVFDVSIKNFDYDAQSEADAFQEKIEAKAKAKAKVKGK